MNTETIILQVNRLYDNYAIATSQNIRHNKVEFLRKELQMSDYDFTQICDIIIKELKTRTFPTLEEIFKVARDIHRYEDKEYSYCNDCDNTGYYTVWQYSQQFNKYFRFGYRCQCNPDHSLPLITPENRPQKPHNPFPPTDTKQHKEYNLRCSDI